jgi:hypothetical protein
MDDILREGDKTLTCKGNDRRLPQTAAVIFDPVTTQKSLADGAAHRFEKDPDRPAQEAFSLVFAKLAELGSALLWFHEHNLSVLASQRPASVILTWSRTRAEKA